MCISLELHFAPFFDKNAAKVLQQTAKTCQYGEKNAEKKMQKGDFFCIFDSSS